MLWGLVAAAAGIAVAPLEPNLLEEGIVVHTAQRMAAGDRLFRDVVSHTGPLPYEFLALLFKIFGAKIFVARAAVVILQAIATASVFATGRRAGIGAFAHAAAAVVAAAPVLLIPLFSTYYYTTVAFYLGLLAVYAGLRAQDSNGWSATAGILVAAIALCKQNAGVQFAVCFIPAVALCAAHGQRLRRLGALLLGGAAVALATLALFASRGDLANLFHAQIGIPLAMASDTTFHTPYINFWPLGRLDPIVHESRALYLPSLHHIKYGLSVDIGHGIVVLTQALYALPFIALLATLVRGAFGRNRPAAWLHAAFLAAMTAGLFPRADWGHLVVALPPAFVQLFLLCDAPMRSAVSPARWRNAMAAAFVGGVGIATVGVAVWLHEIAGPAVFGPHLPLKPVSRAYREPAVARVISYLRSRTTPGEAIFVARQEPLIYFATDTRNPTPFEGVLPGLREWQEPLILAALEDVRFVVMSDIDQPVYTYYSDELPAVWSYLERHFGAPRDYPIDDYNWIMVLSRRPDRGATAVDLIRESEHARAWVRDADGREAAAPERPQRLAARQLRRPLPIALGTSGGGIDFDLTIPEHAVFQSGVGYRGLVSIDHHYIHPRGTTLAVSIDDGDGFEQLASVRIDDRLRAGRAWTPLEADLGPWAGRRVTLRLEVTAARPLPAGELSWFGSPRIAWRPGAEPDPSEVRVD